MNSTFLSDLKLPLKYKLHKFRNQIFKFLFIFAQNNFELNKNINKSFEYEIGFERK
jgi:hypothetical protein